MNGTITKVSNRRAIGQVEIHYLDEQGQPVTIAMSPERIVELHLDSEQVKAEKAKQHQDLHYAYQNAKLLNELLDYIDIINCADFAEHFPDDPNEYKKHWAEWFHTYTQQRKARSHFFLRKGQ